MLYLYLIIYRERTKASREGKSKGTDDEKEREPGQRLDCLPSFPPRPRPLSLPSGGDGRAEQTTNETEREGTRAKYSADLFARSSPLLLLRLMSSPSTPSPADHPIARLCQRSGRGTGGHLVRFWAMSSPHLATTSPPIYQHQGSASTVCHPARLVPVLVPLFCLLPSPSTPSPVLPFRLRLRFLSFFALISSARSHLFALPSSCSSFLALLPAD